MFPVSGTSRTTDTFYFGSSLPLNRKKVRSSPFHCAERDKGCVCVHLHSCCGFITVYYYQHGLTHKGGEREREREALHGEGLSSLPWGWGEYWGMDWIGLDWIELGVRLAGWAGQEGGSLADNVGR